MGRVCGRATLCLVNIIIFIALITNPCVDSKSRSSGIHGKYQSVHTIHYMLDWRWKSYKIVEQWFHIWTPALISPRTTLLKCIGDSFGCLETDKLVGMSWLLILEVGTFWTLLNCTFVIYKFKNIWLVSWELFVNGYTIKSCKSSPACFQYQSI